LVLTIVGQIQQQQAQQQQQQQNNNMENNNTLSTRKKKNQDDKQLSPNWQRIQDNISNLPRFRKPEGSPYLQRH
jgi:3-methyladenine DNA glycosylase/8-oxoguanine DNA glycosylase